MADGRALRPRQAVDSVHAPFVAPTMVITPGRIAYLGLLGSPTQRNFGALAIYVSVGAPFTLWVEGRPRQSLYDIVDPYVPHRIASADRYLMQILIEAETLGHDHPFKSPDAMYSRRIAERVTTGFATNNDDIVECADFDMRFFEQKLPPRAIDRRIARVTKQIRDNPAGRHSAEDFADQVNLSISRFTHLFREETATTLRRFCAWKRARGVMAFVKCEERLVETALSAGFADSTHLSHSVRHFFGLRPKDILAGSRHLTLICRNRVPPAPFHEAYEDW